MKKAKPPRQFRPGDKFGRLTLIKISHTDRRWSRYWLAKCSCGNTATVRGGHLGCGINSCGCLRDEMRGRATTTHGAVRGGVIPTEYAIWCGLKARCYNPKSPCFARYGGRGIGVCRQWRNDFAKFLADMGPRPSSQHTIDRINNRGNYTPSNCRWATWKEQQNNKSNTRRVKFNGKKLTLSEWADELGVAKGTLYQRRRSGWSVKRVLTAPIREWGPGRPLLRVAGR